MVIARYHWKAKTGCREELIKLVKAAVEELGFTPRVCTYVWGFWDTVTSDLEFETMEDEGKFWDNVDTSQPAFAELVEKEPDLFESHWRELLQVH